MSQLFFKFEQTHSDQKDLEQNFIFLPENQASEKFFKEFFSQKSFVTNTDDPSRNFSCATAALKGERMSGKTLLLKNLSQNLGRNNTINFLAASELNSPNYFTNHPQIFQPNQFLVLENIDEIVSEELLLNIINLAFEAKCFLVITHEKDFDFKLPDLRSRIKNFFLTKIDAPQIESVALLLQHLLTLKQIKISQNISDFAVLNLPRSYQKIHQFVNAVDLFCHQNGKDLSLESAKKILSQL